MIGIDIARIKRWYEKEYPTYSGTDYMTVVDYTNQDSHDETPFMQGEDLTFKVGAWNIETKTCVHRVEGSYSRTHYGGWEAHFVRLSPWESGNLSEDESDTNTENGEPV